MPNFAALGGPDDRPAFTCPDKDCRMDWLHDRAARECCVCLKEGCKQCLPRCQECLSPICASHLTDYGGVMLCPACLRESDYPEPLMAAYAAETKVAA